MSLTGRILVITAGAISLLSTFLSYFDYGSSDDDQLTYWEMMHRWDVVSVAMCGGAIAAGVFMLVKPHNRVWQAFTIAAGSALFGNFGYYLVDYSSKGDYAAGAIIGGVGGVLGLVGAVLLAVAAPAAAPIAALAPSTPAPAPAVQPGPGWYSDPAGSGGRRYWDGRIWTDQVHAPT